MKKHKNAIVAAVGDMHVNSTVALSKKSINLDDGGTHRASAAQNFIHDTWVDYWDKVWKQKKKRGAKWPLYVILNGELADDNYHATTQLITKNPADQLRHAVKVLERPIDMADYVFVARGTEAHVGLNAWIDELIARDIGAIGPPELEDVKSWFHLRVSMGGVPFDVAHHPSTGHRVPWTKGADANRLAASLVHRYAEYNHFMRQQGKPEHQQELPQIAIRGHNHRPSDSANNHPVRAIIMPSWQLTNSFGHRLGGDWLPIGGNYFLCKRGEVSARNFYRMWPVADYWRAELDHREVSE
jgi:hypothetical protein